MHHDADIELRLLRAAHSDLDRRAVRHTSYDPAVYALASQVIAGSRQPHPVLDIVPMSRRTCRIARRARRSEIR